MEKKQFTILNLDLVHTAAESEQHQMEVVETAPKASAKVSNAVSFELEHVAHARLLSHIATKAAMAKRRSSSSSSHSPRDDETMYSPRYGKIEQQFLPKETSSAARGIIAPQRAHKIVVRHGQLVDVTEEEEDKMALAVVKKAEEHARERAHISPLKSPRVEVDKVLLPRSPRGSGGAAALQHGYLPSPRGRTSQSGIPTAAPSVSSDAPIAQASETTSTATIATPVTVSFKEIRAAAQEVFLEVYTEVVERSSVVSHATAEYIAETVQVVRPKTAKVNHTMVIETVEVNTIVPSRQSVESTVDGASHPILSLDLTDRELSDAELLPELSQLPDDRTLVLLLNGNDMLREGAEELNRLLVSNKRIQSLQLQWNLLGSEGAAALASGLAATKFLRFVDLTGNELEEEGAIALAAGLKDNRSIQSLVIAENQIGNEGVTVLAQALIGNSTLQTLDVSNNNIFEEGAVVLATVLAEHNRSLVELRLTGNSLRDEGAVALAKAVAVHPVLEHLECRNCVVDDLGIIELCKAVASNPAGVFEYMDLSLNNCSIRSELFMQDLLMNEKRKIEVHWKELDSSRLFEIEEIDAIVDHFGVAAIIDKYLKEETLLPLIPFDVLLPNISFNDPILSDGLVNNVLEKLPHSRTLFIRGMDLLNILLYHLTSSDAIITTITDNHVIDSIFAKLGGFVEILTSDKYNNVHGTAASKARLGFVRFKTLELLVNLMKFNNPSLHEQLVHHKVVSHLLDLLFQWPNNNFVHHQIKDLIVIILYSQSEILLTDLLITARLPQRIMEVYETQTNLDVGFHKGFFGHLTEMANYISTSLPTFHYMRSYHDWAVWDAFVEGPLEENNQILESAYEGCAEA